VAQRGKHEARRPHRGRRVQRRRSGQRRRLRSRCQGRLEAFRRAEKVWAQKEVAKISRKDRKLVTAHSAFGYFCKEYGFEPISLLGVGRNDDADSKHVAETIAEIREHGIKAVFPEDQANPKVLAEIARSTGVKIGDSLVADGTAKHAHTFETMLAHNVRALVAALAPAPAN
jgi:ABC-type Zn uptake system ZnuABC Zn-binding protein ZnuA